jgi:hypothetical protein
MADFLKPPPKFVTNIGAWEYVLAKLAKEPHKNYLDEGGNPRNYGQAVAIYKRVVAKYPAFRTENVNERPYVVTTEANDHDGEYTVDQLDEIFPVGQMFWFDDVLCEAVAHPNIAVYSDPEGKLFIRGKILDVDPDGAHRDWPVGKVSGFPPHRCADFMVAA